MAPIHYIVVHKGSSQPTYTDFTPFQGFSRETIEASIVIEQIVKILPAYVQELYNPRVENIKARIAGLSSYMIQTGPIESLQKLLERYPLHKIIPTICLASQENLTELKKLTTNTGVHCVEYCYDHIGNNAYLKTSKEHIAQFVEEKAKKLYFIPPPKRQTQQQVKITEPQHSHLTVLPNQICLISTGHVITKTEPFKGRKNSDYDEPICASANLVNQIRSDIYEYNDSIIVASPSVSWHFYKNHHSIAFKLFQNDPDAKRHLKALLKRTGYVQQIKITNTDKIETEIDPTDFRKYLSKQALMVQDIREKELRTFSALLSVRTSSSFTPVYRLPEMQAELHSRLTDLGNAVTSEQPSELRARKVNKLGYQLADDMKALIPSGIYGDIIKRRQFISFIGDFPFELIEAGCVPLTMRSVISRIPTLPGEVFAKHILRNTIAIYKLSDLKDILVIRSFEQSSRIKSFVEQAVETFFCQNTKHVNITIVDVNSVEEFKSAINNFQGKILIFDGHGDYDDITGVSTLRIGSEQLNPSILYDEIDTPPIILLSSCHTSPLQGSHISAVNGFLELGASTVLGTNIQIEGIDAAAFMGLLISEISNLIKRDENRHWHWASIISKVQKQFYLLELLKMLPLERWGISKEDQENITKNSLKNIVNYIDWVPDFLNQISKLSNDKTTTEDIENAIRKTAYFTHAAAYVQFGTPEQIVIDNYTG